MQETDKTFIAPPWIKYPTYPEESSFWKTGTGAEYLLKYKKNVEDETEYLKMFPKAPTFTNQAEPNSSLSKESINVLTSDSKPLFIKLWQNDAKPKYKIDYDKEKSYIFMYDTLLTDTSAHIHIGSYEYSSAKEIINVVESEFRKNEPIVWDELKYVVYINALYYKIITDINFIKELIKTGDNEIIFKSDNLELGVEVGDSGEYIGSNLLGLAIMEIRDYLKEGYTNYDLIDWNLSGEPYSKQRCSCGHVH